MKREKTLIGGFPFLSFGHEFVLQMYYRENRQYPIPYFIESLLAPTIKKVRRPYIRNQKLKHYSFPASYLKIIGSRAMFYLNEFKCFDQDYYKEGLTSTVNSF